MLQSTAPPPEAVLARGVELIADAELGRLLDRAAAERPDACALVDGAGRWSFGQLQRWSQHIAHQLLDGGVRTGDIVTFVLGNEAITVAVAAALWRIGTVVNPIVPLYREHEFRFITGQLRPTAVIAAADIRGRDLCGELDAVLDGLNQQPLRLCLGSHDGWASLPDLPAEEAPPLPDLREPGTSSDPCLILYTSGTTADPKGVIHTPGSLLYEVATMERTWGLDSGDVMLMASPLTHITGLLQGLLVPCRTGARAVLMDRWDPARCVELIREEHATYMAGATPFLQGIVEEFTRAGSRPVVAMQYCCGGAAVPPTLIERADALGISAYRCWGMTELPTATLGYAGDTLERRSSTDGPIAPEVEVEAVDEQHRPLPLDTIGELRLRGPEQMSGYVNAELNAGALDADGWFYSGDLGTVDAEGYVRITGRIKDMVNRGGEKLSAREIEDLIAAHLGIREVAVIPLPDERLGESVCAVIVTSDPQLGDDALRMFLREQRIAVQKIPARFERVSELPRTPAGKVRKHELIARFTVVTPTDPRDDHA